MALICSLDPFTLATPKRVLATVGYVQETVLILMFLVDGGHQGRCKHKRSYETMTRYKNFVLHSCSPTEQKRWAQQ